MIMSKPDNKFRIFIWSLFDFANTSYSIIVVTFIYAVYFKDVITGGEPIGDLYWSIGISVSMLISGILAPILGAIADYSAGKKKIFIVLHSTQHYCHIVTLFCSRGNDTLGLSPIYNCKYWI